MTLPIEIENRPCPPYCPEGGHQYTPDRGCDWDYTREHPVHFLRANEAEPPMVALSAMDEFVVGEVRKPGAADEDHVGMLAITADERFLLDGVSSDQARAFAARAERLAEELRAAADRMDEIQGGGR